MAGQQPALAGASSTGGSISDGVVDQREVRRDVLRIAWPSILENLLQSVLGVITIFMVSQLGSAEVAAVGASALLRGSYHLYQGWGGFLGNAAMGVLFGFVFTRTRRAWPIVIAHFLLDVAAGLGYLLFREHLPGAG